MGMKSELRRRLSKAEGRLRREGRRLASVFLCGALIVGNLSAVPVSVLADDDNDYTYEIGKTALQEALQTAVSEGNAVSEDLEFAGEHAEEYAELFEADGTLYELELSEEEIDEDDDRDKALDLRIFARIEGDIPVDEAYEIDGSEEIVFLVSNKTEKTATATISVDGLETDVITILPVDSIAVEEESTAVENTALTTTINRSFSAGGSGGSGSGGSSGSSASTVEETESAEEELVIEITDAEDTNETETGTIGEDSSVEVLDDEDSADMDGDNADVNDTEEKDSSDDAEVEEPAGDTEDENTGIEDDDTKDIDGNVSDADVEDTDSKDSDTAAGDADNENAGGETDDNKSEDGADNNSDAADAESDNTSDAGNTESGNDDVSDESGNDDSTDDAGTSDDNDSSDISEDSEVSVLGSSISIHNSVLLAASIATDSDADEEASASDADNAVDGIVYESVRFDEKGAAAFATTAADLKLDEVVYVEYTAQENDVNVTVTAPAGALPSGAELAVTLYDEDSEEYAAAGESVGYDAEDETTGMAAIDITFYDEDGEEVEPLAPVSVSIDVSTIVPESADTSTIEVQHLAETEEGVEPVLVADVTEDTEGTVDTETVTAEFEVESFSVFTITWSTGNGNNSASTSITATTYLNGTSETIGTGSTSLTGTSGTAFDLTSNNNELEIDGYTLVSASVTYNGTTHTDVTAVTVTVSENKGNKNYIYTYTDSAGETQLHSGRDEKIVVIALYYTENPGITISASGSDDEGYTLTATTANTTSYTYSDINWSISNNSVAKLTVDDDGSVIVEWTEEAVTGSSVIVIVSATSTDSEGNTSTVTDTYTLTNGQVGYTITIKVNNSTVSGAKVALSDSNGNIVAYGTTGSDGSVTFNVLPGTYSITATYTSNNSTIYGYNGSITVPDDGGSTTITLTSKTTYTHVDIEVNGTYSLTIGETTVNLSTYVDSGTAITVVLPDGTVLTNGTYSSNQGQTEYRYDQSISGQWDGSANGNTGTNMGDTYSYHSLNGEFTLSGYVLISVSDVKNSSLTANEIESIFGSYETKTVSGVEYYIITFTDYHPSQNVCPGADTGRDPGYDFEIDINELLVALSEKLIVNKYVIDENGDVISKDDDNTSFQFTLYTSTGATVNSTDLTSGGSYTFEDIETGYYYIEETAVSGYVPVSVTVGDDGSITLSESGYIQYVQTEEKEDGTVASVTYYNLKLDELGVVKLLKSVSESSASGSYSSGTFTFKLYTGNENDGYESVEIAGGEETDKTSITVTTNRNKEFYLAAGTYTIVELGSDLTDGDSQTVTINGITLTRTVAEDDDPFGFEKDTVYYVGIIQVTSGKSITYTATNTYSSNKDIIIKKEDENNNALSGAVFTLTKGTETIDTYTTAVGTGTVTMTGLADGEYTLTETTAPDGYNLLTDSISISISDGTVNVSYTGNTETVRYVTYDSNTMTITVVNTAGIALPETGGPGTTPFRIAGLLLTTCSAYLIYETLRRRRNCLR